MVENSQKIVLIYDLFEDSEEVCFGGGGGGWGAANWGLSSEDKI